MEDTAEIRDRLRRIDSLSGGGAARRELLDEVRRLLEEGERTLRGGEPGPDAGLAERRSRADGDGSILSPRAASGEEASVP
jgi:hypothetical protein